MGISPCFCDYTLFPDDPQFYATFLLMNHRSHKVYNDKFRLSVVSLSQIDIATEEDRRYQIDKWARLFKATTWNPDFVHGCIADVITKSDP